MQSIELEPEFKALLKSYKYKYNRIKAFSSESSLPEFVICRLFNIPRSTLFVLMNNSLDAKTREKIYTRIKWEKRKTHKRNQIDFNNHKLISQTLIRLR